MTWGHLRGLSGGMYRLFVWVGLKHFAWRATPPPVIIYLVSKSEQVQLVDVKWGSGERSSPHLCISQTVVLRTDTCRQQQDREWDGFVPCITLDPKIFQCHWQVQLPVLLGWAKGRSGERDTLRWRKGGHGQEEEEDVIRRLAVQRTGTPERHGQSGHGLSRTSPQVAIITHGSCFCL